MKKQIIAAAVLCTLASGAAMAQLTTEPGPWTLYVRVANLHSVDHDNTGLGLGINDKVILSWTPNLAKPFRMAFTTSARTRAG